MSIIEETSSDAVDHEPQEIGTTPTQRPGNVPQKAPSVVVAIDEIEAKEFYFNQVQVNGPRFGLTLREIMVQDLIAQCGTDDVHVLNAEVRRLLALPTQHKWLLESLGGNGGNILTTPGAVMIQQVSSGESNKFRGNVKFGLDALQSAAQCLRLAVQDVDTGKPLCFDLPDQEELAIDFLKSLNAWALSGLGDEALYRPDIERVVDDAIDAYELAQDAPQGVECEPIELDRLIDEMINACDAVDVALARQEQGSAPTKGLRNLSDSFDDLPDRVADVKRSQVPDASDHKIVVELDDPSVVPVPGIDR